MRIKIVVVEPRYQINLGYIARTCKNFGVGPLVLVNPKCKVDGKNAMKYAKHGGDVLAEARIAGTLRQAVSGTFSVATTGNWRKGRSSLYNIYALSNMAGMLKVNGIDSISLVLGREASGLTSDEMALCSTCMYIPLKGEYGVMNISHALAVMLYELTREEGRRMARNPYAAQDEIKNAVSLFRKQVDSRDEIRDKEKVSTTMAHLLERAHPTKGELSTLAIALSSNKRKRHK